MAHLTTAFAIVGGGMLAGHVLAPYGPGAGPARRALLAVVLLALGAWRGWREWHVRAEWNDTPRSAAHGMRAAAAGAVAALLIAIAGYAVAHG